MEPHNEANRQNRQRRPVRAAGGVRERGGVTLWLYSVATGVHVNTPAAQGESTMPAHSIIKDANGTYSNRFKPGAYMGKRFGRLTVVGLKRNEHRKTVLVCRCKCGNSTTVYPAPARLGITKSCGCLNNESRRRIGRKNKTHGMSTTLTYRVWKAMLRRCYTKSATRFDRYGGRGLTVCDRWRHSFENFLTDIGKPPRGLTLERIDNNGNYSPDNCRWATRQDQARNRKSNRIVTAFGESKPLAAWQDDGRCSVHQLVVRERIEAGWTPELAITKPSRQAKRNRP